MCVYYILCIHVCVCLFYCLFCFVADCLWTHFNLIGSICCVSLDLPYKSTTYPRYPKIQIWTDFLHKQVVEGLGYCSRGMLEIIWNLLWQFFGELDLVSEAHGNYGSSWVKVCPSSKIPSFTGSTYWETEANPFKIKFKVIISSHFLRIYSIATYRGLHQTVSSVTTY